MRNARHRVEGRGQRGTPRIPNIKNEAAPRVMIVGEKHAAGRHRVLGVMGSHRDLRCLDGRHQASEGGRGRVGVDDREKVVPLLGEVARPHQQIMSGERGGRPKRETGNRQCGEETFHGVGQLIPTPQRRS